jgi:hypothetical protein
MKDGCLFFLFQWVMKHTSLGCLQCVVILPLSLISTLQSKLLLLLIMMTHCRSIHHVIMESNIT